MKAPVVAVLDFETEGIESRPAYPPVPVGVSIQKPGEKKPKWYAWGHPTGNNCDKKTAIRAVKEVWNGKEPILCQNAKFDVDVAQTHMDCGPISWERVHDTLYLLFLSNPHAPNLSLKPSAERILGMKPDEQDAVKNWIMANVPGAKLSDWGKYICKAPGTLVGKYADGDSIRTLKLFNKLYPEVAAEGMLEAYNRERRLMPIFLENERQGLRVDLQALENDIEVYQKMREGAERWLLKKLGTKELNFDSDADLAHALNDAGIVTEWAMTKTGKMSTSKKTLTIDKFDDKKVFLVLGYRNRLTTCLGTFMEPWLLKGSSNNGYINPNWNQVRQPKGEKGDSQGTRTGRPSCSDPNLLNVSKSFEDRGDGYTHPKFLKGLEPLPLVRRYALPDKGNQWLHRDYNQQELRILAHFEDGQILEAYKENPGMDIHTFVQEEIERISHKEVDRVSVKTMNFGRIYGQGLGSLAEKLRVPVEEVKAIRNAQDFSLPGLKDLDKAIKDLSKSGAPIVTWGGRLYYVEPPKFVEKFGREMTFEYKLLNYLVQGSAADATKEAVIRYDDVKKDGRFLVTVYDEINICAPIKAVKSEMKILKDVMEGLAFDVPMLTDGKVGKSWGQLEKMKD